MEKEVLFEVRNHVGLITLNRPAALNALSHTMVREMYTQLQAWARDPSIYAVVVKGAGGKAFCAGGDVRAVRASFIASTSMHREFFIDEYRLDHFIHRYPKPYIALMDGIVMGGGMGIAQGASLRVVTDRTRMAMPEVAIGFFPDVGASFFLSRLPAALAAYLGLSGTTIGGADAVHAGLADLYVPSAALDDLDTAFASLRWSADHPADIHGVVRALRAGDSPKPPLADLRPAIDLHFSHSDIPSVVESLRTESRAAYAEWARHTLETMTKRSPLMMAVTARQLARGRTMNLADCFRMELGMLRHSMEQGDFMEGVRAVLVDKDNTPRWNPARTDDVTEEMIAAFFRDAWTKATHPLADLDA